MGQAVRTVRPKFRPAETWGACSRCNARVRYTTLARERLTGLLVCTKASGRAVRPCWDPWPQVLDFQVAPDKSLDPPPEPLPLRYNLDNIWGNGPASGTPTTFASAPAAAPDDATRLAALLSAPPYYKVLGKTASFVGIQALAQPVATQSAVLVTIQPADYDGTFIPSNSIRTVMPPPPNAVLGDFNAADFNTTDFSGSSLPVGDFAIEFNAADFNTTNSFSSGPFVTVNRTDKDVSDPILSPPWAVRVGV